MNWFWINIPLALVFLGLWIGVPMWMVIKHPDQRSAPAAAATGLPAPAGPKAAVVAQRGEPLDAVA